MDENTLCVVFNCPMVNELTGQRFIEQVSANLTSNINHLYILLNTPGGSVNMGIVIYTFLKSLPVKVTTHNIGQVDSIGNVIFVAGEERFATASSTFLFHGIATGQLMGLSVPQMKEAMSQLENDEKRMTSILRQDTNFTAPQIKKLYREGKSINPEEALRKNVISAIKDVEIAPNAIRLVINVN